MAATARSGRNRILVLLLAMILPFGMALMAKKRARKKELSHKQLVQVALASVKASFSSCFHAFPPAQNYIYGRHTLALLDILQSVTESVEQGESRYIIVNIPFRHGKSDQVSRRYGPWHLSRNPSHEVILASYNYSLASSLAFDARQVFKDKIGPICGLKVQADRDQVAAWMIAKHGGSMYAAGLDGTVAGRGAHVLLVDDYCKSREDAESELKRDKVWTTFQNQLMTRLAPVHAVVIVSNRWHEDDLCGRIRNKNDPDHEDYDEDFPVFEFVTFPGQNEDGSWLFSERFPDSWYRTQRASLGSYAWSAMVQQNPKPREGNMLRVDLVNYIGEGELPKGLMWRRGWDVASTEKQRMKTNPDFTVGTLAAYDRQRNRIYVKDVRRGQWSTLARNKKMIQTAKDDGLGVRVKIESVAGYVDTFNTIKAMLRGKAVVQKVTPELDKVARASCFEPIFEAGNAYVVKAHWNTKWANEFLPFPKGKKDDQVDSLVVALHDDIQGQGLMSLTG